jgi:hypothetical protein
MKNLNYILLAALLAAGCKTNNQNSALVIFKVIPAKASAVGTAPAQTLGCVFDPAQQEFTPDLPFNPAETFGDLAAVVVNNLKDTVTVNASFNTTSSVFLPHQAVISYEFIGSATPSPAGTFIAPTSGLEVLPGGGQSTVAFNIFYGLNRATVPIGIYLRATFHIEGKLHDGSTVRTSEREYLFLTCGTPNCAASDPYSVVVNGFVASCF